MYNLNEVDQTSHSIITYVCKAMKKMKLGSEEIKEYTQQAKMYDFSYCLQISQEYIEMLNKMEEQKMAALNGII